MLKATWSDWDTTYKRDIDGYSDAQEVLEQLSGQLDPPRLVEFYHPTSGRSLGIGVGREKTVLTYQDSIEPPYFISLGDQSNDAVEWFCYGNERTEYKIQNLIPYEIGRLALRQYFERAGQPDIVLWEKL